MGTDGPTADDAHGASEGARDPRLRWYPRSWRVRYGDELVALLDDEYDGRPPALTRLGLVTGGLRQRARQSGLTGDSASPADGVRAGALLVLAAWTAFAIAGAGFAKFSEHFDEALPHRAAAHQVPDIAFTVLQAVAGVAGVLVIVGALLAAPAFVRYLRADGWTSVRGHCRWALACTAVTGAATVPVLLWAHHLTPDQRNGGLPWYGVVFLIWAALAILTLTSWAVVAVAAARRVELPAAVLTAEAALAGAVAVAMVAMVGATVVWWAAMAHSAPGFLDAGPGGTSGPPWDLWLVTTVALMAVAMGAAAVGVVREVRLWTGMRAG